MKPVLKLSLIATVAALAGCVTVPTGPSVMALPGTGKSFEQFRADDATCRQFAYDQIGGNTATAAAQQSGVTSAAVGTVLGAAAGAAIGGNSSGAWTGAGAGLALGGLAGTGAAQSSAYGAQGRYDNAYTQCMYAQGHRVPVPGRYSYTTPPRYAPPPVASAPAVPPPPPGGTPPPPPPTGSAPPR